VQKRGDRSDELGDCRGTKETGMLRREFVTSGSAIFPSGYLAVIADQNRALEATGQIRQAFSLWADERRLR